MIYAAALGLLIQQLRENAPMPDVLASVGRLCVLARVGSVTIAADAIDTSDDGSVGVACRILRDAMQDHGVIAMDVATTITDAEFLKLAGILRAPASIVSGSIVDTAAALSIWNVRLRTLAATARPTPLGMRAVPVETGAAASDARPPAEPMMPLDAASATAASATAAAASDDAMALALLRGDARAVCTILLGIDDPAAFARAASPTALQMAVEQLLEGTVGYDEGHALLQRAGAPGARAVFDQLVAATDTSERRFLYDLAASLKAIADVAKEHVNDPTWYVVRNATGLLGESRAPWAVTELSKLLRHTDQRVRVAAVVGLGQIGGAVALSRLESVLFDASIEVRNRALAIVFATPDHDPLPDRVLMALEEENALEYRLEVIAALGHVQTPKARAKLESFVRKTGGTLDDHQVRLAAMSAFAANHPEQARELMRAMLEDENPYVRERAAALLG